jgi:prolyl 4-hydroxylase
MSSNLALSSMTGLVTEVSEFLTTAECEFVLRELEFVHWRHSHLISHGPEGQERAFISPRRVSETANQEWFTDDLDAFIRDIEIRLMCITPFDASHLEYWQATRYSVGGELDHHLDAGYWTNHYARERKLTFLIYLTTPLRGGSTYFRALDRDVKAVAGRMIVWNNLFEDGRPNHKTIHCGSPLELGEKVTLVTWLRQRPFRL